MDFLLPRSNSGRLTAAAALGTLCLLRLFFFSAINVADCWIGRAGRNGIHQTSCSWLLLLLPFHRQIVAAYWCADAR